jgi:hypothetical protein
MIKTINPTIPGNNNKEKIEKPETTIIKNKKRIRRRIYLITGLRVEVFNRSSIGFRYKNIFCYHGSDFFVICIY